MGIIGVQEPQTEYDRAAARAWEATQEASADDTGENHEKAVTLHLAAARLAKLNGLDVESDKHSGQADEHLRQARRSGQILESRDTSTVYRTFRNTAEDASARAKARPTVSNHRKAAEANLAAGAHAAKIGDGDAAAEHDACAQGHIFEMNRLSGDDGGDE